ncbi:hypothetical protein DITRI_Ditri09bG0149300 [Diplodiscus trichospermus]
MRTEAINSKSREESVVIDYGCHGSSCGYCKSSGQTSISHGLWAYSLTVNDYQDHLDRGWRRCGCFLYKPEMERTCCPSYTIRLKASDFVPSKEQRRVYRRMQRFLDGTLEVRKPNEFTDDPNTSEHIGSSVHHTISSSAGDVSFSRGHKVEDKAEEFMHHLSDQIDKVVHAYIASGEFPSGIQFPKAAVKKVTPAKRKLSVEGSGDLLYSCNIAFQIAATLRRKQSAEGLQQLGMSRQSSEENDLNPKCIAEKLACSLNQLENISGLSIRACSGHINFYSGANASSDGDARIVALPEESGSGSKSSCTNKSSEHPQGQKRKLETQIVALPEESGSESKSFCANKSSEHPQGQKRKLDTQIVALPEESGSGSKSSCANNSSEHPQGQKRKLEIRLKRSSFDPEEYALYRRYQIKVHNETPDSVTENSYRMFLVDTPLFFVSPSADGMVPPCGFGSFHQQYIIDGKLVAVGVIDILPRCLSSKYLFWDPDYAFLSLGKYSALQEIGWVKENQACCASLQYYYLGYYIHSCSKMRYKAEYHPSELLCPLRYRWVPFHLVRPLLDKKKYVILSDIASLQDVEVSQSFIPENVMELQHHDIGPENTNDVLMDDDEEMAEVDSDGSDDELPRKKWLGICCNR